MPIAIFSRSLAFCRSVILLSVVAYRVAASLVNAVFSCQAVLAVRIALLSRWFFCSALFRLVTMRTRRLSFRPSATSVLMALSSVVPRL